MADLRKCEAIEWIYRVRCSLELHGPELPHTHWSNELGAILWYDQSPLRRTHELSESDLL